MAPQGSNKIVLDVSDLNENQINTVRNSIGTDVSEIENLLYFDLGEGESREFVIENGELSLFNRENRYIVEFESEPLLKKEKKPSELISHKEKIDNEQKEALDKIKNKINQKSVFEKFTDNVKKASGFQVRESEIKVERRFSKAFNGAVIQDLSKDDVEEIRKLGYNVFPDNKAKIFLPDSVNLINADKVWNLSYTGKNVTIAILDTGVDYTHPDLGGCFGSGCKVVGGYDFINNDADPMDDNGHGTHVAATAAGRSITFSNDTSTTNSSDGGSDGGSGGGGSSLILNTSGGAGGASSSGQYSFNGVAPDADIYAVKVLSSGGGGSFSTIIAGIEHSVDPNGDGDFSDKVDIISMSLGGPGDPDDPMSKAVDNAVDAGVIVVVAAGNSGPYEQTIGSPGTARKAITVGATEKNDSIAHFSSRGPVIWNNGSINKPDVVAPGVEICAARFDDAYSGDECFDNEHASISGTSMATPHVAGLAALLRQKYPDFSADDIKALIRTTARDLGLAPNIQGTGRIDALRAINSSINILGELDFGRLRGSENSRIKTFSIKNIAKNNVSLSLSVEPAVGEDEESLTAVALNETEIIIPPGEERKIEASLSFPLTYDGIFTGKVLINDSVLLYSVPYSFSRHSELNLEVEGEHYPHFFLHSNDLKIGKGLSQGFDFIGNKAAFFLRSGNYTIYAKSDLVNPDDPISHPETDEYILMDKIEIQIGEMINKTFRLNDAKKYTLKARSINGEELYLYEWTSGAITYKNKVHGCSIYGFSESQCINNSEGLLCNWNEGGYCSDSTFSFSFFDPSSGDKEVYLSNKPNNSLDTDILLKYLGANQNV